MENFAGIKWAKKLNVNSCSRRIMSTYLFLWKIISLRQVKYTSPSFTRAVLPWIKVPRKKVIKKSLSEQLRHKQVQEEPRSFHLTQRRFWEEKKRDFLPVTTVSLQKVSNCQELQLSLITVERLYISQTKKRVK